MTTLTMLLHLAYTLIFFKFHFLSNAFTAFCVSNSSHKLLNVSHLSSFVAQRSARPSTKGVNITHFSHGSHTWSLYCHGMP